MQKIISKIRNSIPLSLRIKIGPFVAYCAYFFNVYIYKNSWKPHVLSLEDTIEKITREKLSVIRFGDGEMSLIENDNLGFQEKNSELAEKLKMILQTNKKGLLICIVGIWGNMSRYNAKTFWFNVHHLFKYGYAWKKLLSNGQIYGDAFITRPYLLFKDEAWSGKIFTQMKLLWKDRDVVLIEGEKSRLGVGNDLFDKVLSLKRILCPSENAFSKYEAIKKEAIKINKDALVLISLGPTAKVLVYDLFMLGYQAIDIGHIDMEYEMFLRKETKIVKVRYKYFNEINERNPEICDDPKYLSQIIATIK